MNLLVFLVAAFVARTIVATEEKKIVCYVGTWATYRPGAGKFDIEDIDPKLCTHLFYTFVGLDTESDGIKILDPWQDLPDDGGHDGFRRFKDLRKQNEDVKLIVAIGGWNEGSIKYSDMSADLESRKRFVDSAVEFVKKYDFDGLDVDWEYPAQRGGEEEDVDNFSTLIKALREAFDKEGLILSAAVAAPRSSASQSYDIAEISKHLDIINILSYDYHGAWENFTGLNAPLYHGSSDSGRDREWTVDASVKYWLAQGAPREKLVMGIPFYGKSWTLLTRHKNGIGDAAVGPGYAGPFTRQEGILGYLEICDMQQRRPWTVHFDEEGRSPYAHRGHQWVGYDDIRSIREKVEYIKKMDLGGAMVWSLENDDFRGNCGAGEYPLLNCINQHLRN